MNHARIAATAALVAMLSSCATQPSLNDQLAGKQASQRQALLIEACHAEAGKGSGAHRSALFRPHVRRMQDICDRMAREFGATSPVSQGE